MPRHPRSFLLVAVAVMLIGIVAACSGPRPLYGVGAVDPVRYSFTYGKPENRSDQVIYRELRLALPERAGATETIEVTVASTIRSRKVVNTPDGPTEVVATANVTARTASGEVVFSGRRSATTTLGSSNQVIANTQASVDGAERAAIALAETIRLSLLAALAGR